MRKPRAPPCGLVTVFLDRIIYPVMLPLRRVVPPLRIGGGLLDLSPIVERDANPRGPSNGPNARARGREVERVVGWDRDGWRRLTGLQDLGRDLPPLRPG